jgi:hypothetical protein
MTIPGGLAVIVLGMHRGGTSAVAGTAVRLGLAPPRTMLPPSADNPAGFYESIQVATLNEALLRSVGCYWDTCLSFDPDRLDGSIRSAAFDRCLGILREEFAAAPAFMIKDPRLCLTLPVWLPALRSVGAAVAALLVIRHPQEVVRSLAWRNQLPETVTAPLWLHHMLEAERATRSLPRAVVAYDELLRDWRGCMVRAGGTAGIVWPARTGGERPEIDAFLNLSLRHHVAEPGPVTLGSPSVSGLIDLTWTALQELRRNPSAAFPLEWLDQARATFVASRSRNPRA